MLIRIFLSWKKKINFRDTEIHYLNNLFFLIDIFLYTNQKSNSTQIENIYYVKGLKHNLLSISQLCNNGYVVKFEVNACLIKEESTRKVLSLV